MVVIMVPFLIMEFLLYFGFMNVVLALFGIQVGLMGYVLLTLFCLVLGSLYPVLRGTEAEYSTRFTRALYHFSSFLVLTVLFYLLHSVILLLVCQFVSIPVNVLLLIYIILFLVIIYSIYNAYNIKIKEVTVKIDSLESEKYIVQLSDIHAGSIVGEDFVNKIVNKIQSIDKDILAVVITGDLADGTSQITEESFKMFKKIKPPIFFVSGNHDAYIDLNNIYRAVEAADMIILDGKVSHLDDIELIGIPTVGMGFGESRVGGYLDNIPYDHSKADILLYHLPNEWNVSRDYDIDLQLSGHTHGGQFYPATLFTRLGSEYVRGLFRKDDKYLYVSDGLGVWGPMMRLGTSCELVLLHLKP